MITLVLGLLIIQAEEEAHLDSPSLEWVTARAPYGMDITLDGKVWINTNRTGARDDYAILANDLYKAINSGAEQRRAWFRGYHLRNSKVNYRETKQLVTVDCKRDNIWVERKLAYAPGGELLSTSGPYSSEPVVPGSLGESWRDALCADGQ